QALVDQGEAELAPLDAAARARRRDGAAHREVAADASGELDALLREAPEPGERGHVEARRAADRGRRRHAPQAVGAAPRAQPGLALHAAELLALHVDGELDAIAARVQRRLELLQAEPGAQLAFHADVAGFAEHARLAFEGAPDREVPARAQAQRVGVAAR